MKRSLLILPFLFLLLFNACSGGANTPIPDEVFTAAAQTNIARGWTQVPTRTPHPQIPTMISTLNAELSSFDSLEWTLDAGYIVYDADIERIDGYSSLVFRVDVRCDCRNGDECCYPERTFVTVLKAMEENHHFILAYIPTDVGHLLVVCSDQKKFIGAMTVPWQDAREYLQGNLTGYQFGARITKTDFPK